MVRFLAGGVALMLLGGGLFSVTALMALSFGWAALAHVCAVLGMAVCFFARTPSQWIVLAATAATAAMLPVVGLAWQLTRPVTGNGRSWEVAPGQPWESGRWAPIENPSPAELLNMSIPLWAVLFIAFFGALVIWKRVVFARSSVNPLQT